ncbi:hypothetical protein N7486_005636 [Penicillium sp. IBT 16267x]|nr:hypothetical protein N7486_005636 [Penicillium sp. IBT 16267x]
MDEDFHEITWSPVKPVPENGYLVQRRSDEVVLMEDNFALTIVKAIDLFCGFRPQPKENLEKLHRSPSNDNAALRLASDFNLMTPGSRIFRLRSLTVFASFHLRMQKI